MQFLSRLIARTPPSSYYCGTTFILSKFSSSNFTPFRNARVFSSESDTDGGTESDKDNQNQHHRPWSTNLGGGGGGGGGGGASFAWDDSVSSWSTGLTKDHFDGEALGRKVSDGGHEQNVSTGGGRRGGGWKSERPEEEEGDEDALERTVRERLEELMREEEASRIGNDIEDEDEDDMDDEAVRESLMLCRQIDEPGARGAYLKDSEKSEMYRLHKENPEVYNVEKLAKDYRIMRQRVVAILWLKEFEEEEEKKRGEPLDDSVELLIDTFPEFFISHDREFHVASLPYKPDFKVMPEGWDGTTKDPDEVHYEISKKEDDMLYEEFLQRFKFNTMKFKGKVNVHKYSRRRPSDGWTFKVEKLGSRGKRGGGGGWKFASQPDGSTRPLNETEKMYVKREAPRRRRKILP